MSLENIIRDVEAEAKKLNPGAIAAEVASMKARIENAELALARLAPTIEALIRLITPLLPVGTAIPAEVMSLLALLPKPVELMVPDSNAHQLKRG